MGHWLRWFDRSEEADGWSGFLERECRLEGELDVRGTFRIDGQLQGRIRSSHLLVIGESGEVVATVEAETVVIYGRFRGTIRARQRVEVHAGATVGGDLEAPCIVLDAGSDFHGSCYLSDAEQAATSTVRLEKK